MSKTQTYIQSESKYLVPTYARQPIVFSHGHGAYVYDLDGKRYLDFASGIAVTALGHSDETWAAAVAEQAHQLVHVSNLYYSPPQIELAQRLVENSFADRVFFCNSGSEANETAIKFARKWARARVGDNDQPARFTKTDIVAFTHSFHGRTVGALSLTAKAEYREPFAPLMPGVTFAEFNDLESARQTITGDTCAVIVEPVQGEGGVHPAEPAFLDGLRQLCDENQVLLIFDEVQCGLGRTGYLWAHQAYGVEPDMMTLAKPLAGGLPIGAVLVKETVSQVIRPGDHGSTFAGGPLICRAAQVVFDRVNQPHFLEAIRAHGNYLQHRLEDLASDKVVEVRGAGLLAGLELNTPVRPLITAALEKGLVLIGAGETVLRLTPPLIISGQQIDFAVDVIAHTLSSI